MPVLLAGREPDHVTRPDVFDRPAPPLRAPEAGGHDQRLAKRMCVPRRSRARLERHGGAGNARRLRRWMTGSIRTVPVKYSAGPLPTDVNRFA
jgi:hypothetical protein